MENTPDEPDYVEIAFEQGVPIAINGEEYDLADLIKELNQVAGKHGIGRIDHVENRLIGIKSREVYEAPGAEVLLKAHKDLEDLTTTKDLAHFKPIIEKEIADTIYNALWYTPLFDSLKAFIDESQKEVNGVVRVKLFKGNVICEGRQSKNSLYSLDLATYTSADAFDQESAAGFIKLYSLPSVVHAQVKQKLADAEKVVLK